MECLCDGDAKRDEPEGISRCWATQVLRNRGFPTRSWVSGWDTPPCFWMGCYAARGILVPQPRIEPMPPALES